VILLNGKFSKAFPSSIACLWAATIHHQKGKKTGFGPVRATDSAPVVDIADSIFFGREGLCDQKRLRTNSVCEGQAARNKKLPTYATGHPLAE
jgi:hypothetical protein